MPTTTYTDVTFGARNIGARTDTVPSGVTDLSAEEDRFSQAMLMPGIVQPANGFVPVSGGAATWDVDLGSGTAKADYALVQGDNAGQGNYLIRLASAQETVTIDSADGSNPRIDEIYLVVLDGAYDSGSYYLPRFGYRKGDAAGSPNAPGPDASWDAELLIATIDVPSGVADIEACTITDERVASGFTLGDGIEFTYDGDDAIIDVPSGGTVRLRVNGSDEVTVSDGTVDLGGNDLDNVGSGGFDASAHAARHLPSGDDGLTTAAPGTIEPDDSAVEGAAESFSKSDHQHAIAAGTATDIDPAASAAEGSATSFSRSDHVHGIDGDFFDQGIQMARDEQSSGWDDVNASWDSFKEQAGFTFTKPSDWTSYDIMVTATGYFADDSGGYNTEVNLRCSVGASEYISTGATDTDSVSGTNLVANVLKTGNTGNTTIAVDTSADAPYVVRDCQIWAVAYRVS